MLLKTWIKATSYVVYMARRSTDFGPDLLAPHVTSFLFEEGRFEPLAFLVVKVIPPFLAG